MVVMAGVGLITIYIRQRSGLHAKRKTKGVLIYHSLFARLPKQ